jgi:hypothetical protein
MLPHDCTTFYYVLDDPLFLQPQLLPDKTQFIMFSMINSFFGLSAYITGNQGLTNSQKRYCSIMAQGVCRRFHNAEVRVRLRQDM